MTPCPPAKIGVISMGSKNVGGGDQTHIFSETCLGHDGVWQ